MSFIIIILTALNYYYFNSTNKLVEIALAFILFLMAYLRKRKGYDSTLLTISEIINGIIIIIYIVTQIVSIFRYIYQI